MIGCSNCGTDIAAEIEKSHRIGAASRLRTWAERKRVLGLITQAQWEMFEEAAKDLEVGA